MKNQTTHFEGPGSAPVLERGLSQSAAHGWQGRFEIESGFRRGDVPAVSAIENRKSKIEKGFSLVELLVVMTLLSLIVLALMAVFNSTQQAFRAGVTQTDVLEGSRAAVDLITADLRGLTPSGGMTNYFDGNGGYHPGAVNFSVSDND